MPKPTWDRIKKAFEAAIDAPESERAAILDRACEGDAELRREVESLLMARTRSLVRTGGAGAAIAGASTASVAMPPITEGVGSVIGPYKILQLIGEGGFGMVFLAEQSAPVRRRIALKIIKLGMDTKQVVARFEAERQALALMDHPNIARVYDGGATEAGRPFFVMEYVVGDAITAFTAAHRLDVRARLDLFVQVCRAVQHAHTKGVIHRDLKPGNVLVTMVDGRPHAKVIDFGIAKATGALAGLGGVLTPRTLFTEHGQLIGTPEYMSPEQADGSPDIDTRTDVYALGVLLYELLTGLTPFDARRLRSAGWAGMQKIIREEEPAAPSVRLKRVLQGPTPGEANASDEPDALARVVPSSAAHATGARAPESSSRISPDQVRGELDWIVMKALDKDRGRRYESPGALADDVGRHLSGEAVGAAPPARMYRLRKFVRRNKGPVAAGAAVGAALVLGIAGTTWQWRSAHSANERIGAQVGVASRALSSILVEHLNHSEKPQFPLIPGSPPYRLTPKLTPDHDRPDLVSIDVTKQLEIPGAQPVPVAGDDLLPALADISVALAKQSLAVQDDLERQVRVAERSAYAANLLAAAAATADGQFATARQRLDTCPEYLRRWEWGYLDAQLSDAEVELRSESGKVDPIMFSPDGASVLGSVGAEVVAWDALTGAAKFSLKPVNLVIKDAFYSGDGAQIATFERVTRPEDPKPTLLNPEPVGNYLYRVRIWNSATGAFMRSVDFDSSSSQADERYAQALLRAVRSWDGIDLHPPAFSGFGDAALRGAGRIDSSMRLERAVVLLVSPDARRFVVEYAFAGPSPGGQVDLRQVRYAVHDLADGSVRWALSAQAGLCPPPLMFSRDSRRLLCGSTEGTAVWDVETGTMVYSKACASSHGNISDRAISDDSELVAQPFVSPSGEFHLQVVRVSDGAEMFLSGPLRDVARTVSFSSDKRWMVAGVGEQTRVWELESRREVAHWSGQAPGGTFIDAGILSYLFAPGAFSPDSQRVVTRSWDGAARVWSLPNFGAGETRFASGMIRACFAGSAKRPAMVGVQIDAAEGSAPALDIYDAISGRRVRRIPGGGADGEALWSGDGSRIIGDADGIQVCDIDAGEIVRKRDFARAAGASRLLASRPANTASQVSARALACSPDARKVVVSIDRDDYEMALQGAVQRSTFELALWDVDADTLAVIIPETAGVVRGVSMTPDGRCIAASVVDDAASRVLFAHTDGPPLLRELATSHWSFPVTPVFSPDGGTVYAMFERREAPAAGRVSTLLGEWDSRTGERKRELLLAEGDADAQDEGDWVAGVSDDARLLAVVDERYSNPQTVLMLVDLEAWRLRWRHVNESAQRFDQVLFSPGGDRILASRESEESGCDVFDASDGTHLLRLPFRIHGYAHHVMRADLRGAPEWASFSIPGAIDEAKATGYSDESGSPVLVQHGFRRGGAKAAANPADAAVTPPPPPPSSPRP